MDFVEKFYSDVRLIIKRDRSDNGGNYDSMRASKSIARHFISLNKDLGDLPQNITDYWISTYIERSDCPEKEPTEEHITWLGAATALLDGSFDEHASDEEKSAFSKADWKELCELVNYEAEELPIDILSSLMTVFTDRKAL
ncbi:MAG: hypothetical protein R3Y36_07610 [Spirochaetales bacterium]